MIDFKFNVKDISVILDGKTVGKIKAVGNGWAYFPKGSKSHGDILPTIRDVQKQITEA